MKCKLLCHYASLDLNVIYFIIVNVKNICNLTDREEYNIGHIVLFFSILYSLTKQTTPDFRGAKK